jgi:hypothetical protein
MQPHPMTSVMQMSITAASLCVAAAAIVFAIKSMSEERNARLVEIGVGVLKVDPSKETQVAAARKWAIDLIDANAGGVKFTPEARVGLLQNPIGYDPGYSDYSNRYIPDYTNTYPKPPTPVKPRPQSN